jgi:hypothetical protein
MLSCRSRQPPSSDSRAVPAKERAMTRERTLSAVGTGEVSARELGNSAAARSREVAEQLWVAVCRGIRAGHQQRPAFVFPERTAVMSSSRCTTQWSLVVVLGLGLATSVTAQEADRSSRGVYNFPKTPTLRSGVVQKVNPGGAKPDIVVTDLAGWGGRVGRTGRASLKGVTHRRASPRREPDTAWTRLVGCPWLASTRCRVIVMPPPFHPPHRPSHP